MFLPCLWILRLAGCCTLLEEARRPKQNRRRSCNVAKRERQVDGFRVDSDSEALPKSTLHSVDPHLAKGYRPIAVLSVLSKVMEGLIKDRLSHILESEHRLSDQQQGFRQGRSTELALWRFVTSATSALKTRKRCVAVALDIERAYDTVDHTALLWKLKSKGILRYLVA